MHGWRLLGAPGGTAAGIRWDGPERGKGEQALLAAGSVVQVTCLGVPAEW